MGFGALAAKPQNESKGPEVLSLFLCWWLGRVVRAIRLLAILILLAFILLRVLFFLLLSVLYLVLY